VERSGKEAGISIGCWLNTPSLFACEIMAAAGYDAVFLDGEHGILGPHDIDRLTALGKALGLSVYVRVATAGRPQIQQALDAGADGLILPQVRDFEDARACTAYAKYPPLGTRGMGSPRSLKYGDTPANFVDSENRRTRCFVMIETEGAMRDVDRIVALPTVDGLYMGPYDLSLQRGRGQYTKTAGDRADADRIARATHEADKLLGIPAFGDDDLALAKSQGASIITIGDEVSMMTEILRGNLLRVRKQLAG